MVEDYVRGYEYYFWIYGFYVYYKRGHLLFINIFSLLLMVVISLGVGYGMALFVVELSGSFLKWIIILSVGFGLFKIEEGE